MTTNRCVPTDAVLPHIYYTDADAASAWLSRVFGFVERYRVPEDDGRIHIAQLQLGPAFVMIRYARDGELSPRTAGGGTQSLMVLVQDVDAHHAAAVAAGAQVTAAPVDQIYGEREYSVFDLDGHRWTFAQHDDDVDPASIFVVP